ncbi:MAG: DUF4878 domain-containing protein [Ginsengibacter sp.]
MKKIILLVSTALVVFMSSCNSNNGNPKEVLGHFFDAMSHKNIEEAKKYVTKDSEGMMGMMQMGMKNMDNKDQDNDMFLQKENMDIGNAVINGDRATVPVKDKKSGETTDFVLKKEGGAWKVAFDKSTLMEMGQKKMKEHGMDTGGEMDMKNMNLDSMQDKMNKAMDSMKAAMPDMKDKMEHAQKMMDSAQKMMEKTNKTP